MNPTLPTLTLPTPTLILPFLTLLIPTYSTLRNPTYSYDHATSPLNLTFQHPIPMYSPTSTTMIIKGMTATALGLEPRTGTGIELFYLFFNLLQIGFLILDIFHVLIHFQIRLGCLRLRSGYHRRLLGGLPLGTSTCRW